MTIRATFRKHFDADGQADDYPTDFFRPPDGALEDMVFIEMREPAADAQRNEDGASTAVRVREHGWGLASLPLLRRAVQEIPGW